MFFVYVLLNLAQRLYVGHTKDLVHRVDAHRNNRGAVFTKYNGPWMLVHYEVHTTRDLAKQRESALKHDQNSWLCEHLHLLRGEDSDYVTSKS
jgi:predicted GIY-YIG superfamily endonuclease